MVTLGLRYNYECRRVIRCSKLGTRRSRRSYGERDPTGAHLRHAGRSYPRRGVRAESARVREDEWAQPWSRPGSRITGRASRPPSTRDGDALSQSHSRWRRRSSWPPRGALRAVGWRFQPSRPRVLRCAPDLRGRIWESQLFQESDVDASWRELARH